MPFAPLRALVPVSALTLALVLAPALSAPALAEEDGPAGTLNPEEMTMGRVLEGIARGETSMTNCAAGYLMTKSGRHAAARATFRACAEAGYTGAMTWMSQLDTNGLGAPEDPEAAADWNRRAAEAGDPVGLFNHGLDLMRGYGVARDEAAGRAMVDRAAALGNALARRLVAAGYDLDEVTPDADNWKWAPSS